MSEVLSANAEQEVVPERESRTAAVRSVSCKWPFLPIALSMIAGIVSAKALDLSISSWIGAACLAAPMLLARPLRYVGGALLIFAFGASVYMGRYEVLRENDLRLILPDKAALVTIRGQLAESPSLRDYYHSSNAVEYSYARIAVSEIQLERQWRNAQGTVAAVLKGDLGPEFFQGRTVEVSGVIDRPKRPQAPGLFDYREYLYNARIFYQLRCETTNDWRLLSYEPLSIPERFARWAQQRLRLGLPLQDEPLEMLWTMTLGWKKAMSGEIADVFMRTGTMHIFAISGLHVACLAGCFMAVFHVLGMPRSVAGLALIGVVWFYTVATGWQSSAIRSALMSSFVFAGWLLARPTSLINSLAAAAACILAFQPEQLFQASFQLSFAVVGALAVLLARVGFDEWPGRFERTILRLDPFLPDELQPAWKRMLQKPLAFVVGNFAVSWAAWVGSLPVIAYYFNTVTPISLFANIVAVPLSSLSLACALGSLLCPPASALFNFLAWAFMWETIEFCRCCARIPWGCFYVPKPNIWFFLFYFGAISSFLIPALREGKAKWWSRGIALAAACCWIISIVPVFRAADITMLSIPGTPLFVDEPGHASDLLIDCSRERDADYTLKRFLRGQGIGSVANLAISHTDVSRIGGYPVVLREFEPRAIFTTAVRARTRAAREFGARLEKDSGARKIAAGDQLAGWLVLHPALNDSFPRGADNALVLRKEISGWKVLFLSDLGLRGQRALLERATNLEADIVFASVPDRDEPLTPELLNKINPRVIVLGITERLFRNNNAEKSLLRRLRDSGATVLSTAQAGSVDLRVAKSQCLITTTDGQEFRLRQAAR